jgi:hypothetical protein
MLSDSSKTDGGRRQSDFPLLTRERFRDGREGAYATARSLLQKVGSRPLAYKRNRGGADFSASGWERFRKCRRSAPAASNNIVADSLSAI